MPRPLPETIGSSRGLTVEGASAALLADLLVDFEAELRAHGVPVDRYLRPGATADAVRAEFASAGLVAPEEAICWFQWHDGRYEVPGSERALPVFDAWSLDYLKLDREDPNSQTRGYGRWDWNPNWIHIMGEQVGLAMSCAGEPAEPPLVRMVAAGLAGTQDDDTESQVVSLCTPVTWWIDSIRRGWYVWDRSAGAWSRDDAAQPLIRAIYGLT
jgi:hypothetical protein